MTIIAEDNLRRIGDPALKNRDPNTTLTIKETVYHYAETASLNSAAALTKFLSMASNGHPLNAFLIHQEVIAKLQADATKPGAAISHATAVSAIINAAFDYESYIVWLPAGR